MNFFDNLELKKKLIIGFSVPLVLIVIIATTVFFSLNALLKSSKWVNHTYEAIDLGNSITASLVNMETGLRGFLVSGEDNFLEPYHGGKSEFIELIQKTKEKVSDNPKQVARLNKIEEIESAWQTNHVNIAIDYRREVSAGAAAAKTFSEVSSRTVGKDMFDGFRSGLSKLERSVSGSDEAQKLIKLILIAMINQETGQRGFLLSGKEASLEPYKQGIKDFDNAVKKLNKRLKRNNSRKAINILNDVTKKARGWKTKAADPEIKARRDMNKVTRTMDDVTLFIKKGIGKKYMDEMRLVIDAFVAEESALIAVRNDEQKSTAAMTKAITVMGALFSVFVGLFITYYITRTVLKQLGADPVILKEIAEKISEGELDIDLSIEDSDGVQKSMAEMRKNLSDRGASDIQLQKDIDRLVSAAVKGDFTKAISLNGKDGVHLNLSKGLNSLIKTCDSGLDDVKRVLGAIADGDLTQKITANYEGSFNELKQYSNNTVTQLNDVMGEIGNLVNAANNGDFTTNIELKGKQGFFKDLSHNLNILMNTTDKGLADVLRILEALANGDLSQSIDDKYHGSFKLLKENANNTVTQINMVIGEISGLVDQANLGDFTADIDLSGKNGFFLDLSESLNKLVNTTNNGLSDVLRIFEALANGDLTQTIDDEYYGTFKALKEYSNNTIQQIDQIMNEISGLVDEANQGSFKARIDLSEKSGFFRSLSSSLNDLMETTDSGLEDVVTILMAFAEGDLSKRIEREYSGSFAQLKNDANLTAEKLTDIVTQIKTSSTAIASSTSEIAAGNLDLSSRTEQQASALEETASSMEEMTSTIKESAENAYRANELSITARKKADEGGRVVEKAVLAMDDINQASKRIADIIGVIDEIAFQTNLLALNAAVEAARAGEQGRGFAVVAGEVRNLAQRSASAAKEIKDLIQDSVQKVEDGTTLVNSSGNTLKEILDSVKQVSQTIEEISDASKEQSAGIQQVGAAISQMDTMTQQNAALAEQASAAGVSMSDEAEAMTKIVGFFSSDSRV